MMLKIIWGIVTFLSLIALYFFIIPYIKRKILLYSVSRTLRSVAKNAKDKKTKDKLNSIADKVDEVRKSETMDDV